MCSEFSGEQPHFKELHEARQEAAEAKPPCAPPASAYPTPEQVRAALCAKFPCEFEHGYRTGYTGEFQQPFDQAGYMTGHHTWPLERKNAWFAGFNLGHAERESDHG